MSFPPPEIDHVAAAQARLAQWASDRPNILAFLAGVNASSNELETAFQDLITSRVLDNAADDQLTQLGLIVGQVRNGATDTVLRQYIRTRIRLNRSSGTSTDILAVMRLALISIAAVPNSIWLHRQQGGSFLLTIQEQQSADLAAIMQDFLRQVHAAGVRAGFEWWESAPANMFRLDSGPGLDQGHLAGGVDAV